MFRVNLYRDTLYAWRRGKIQDSLKTSAGKLESLVRGKL